MIVAVNCKILIIFEDITTQIVGKWDAVGCYHVALVSVPSTRQKDTCRATRTKFLAMLSCENRLSSIKATSRRMLLLKADAVGPRLRVLNSLEIIHRQPELAQHPVAHILELAHHFLFQLFISFSDGLL